MTNKELPDKPGVWHRLTDDRVYSTWLFRCDPQHTWLIGSPIDNLGVLREWESSNVNDLHRGGWTPASVGLSGEERPIAAAVEHTQRLKARAEQAEQRVKELTAEVERLKRLVTFYVRSCGSLPGEGVYQESLAALKPASEVKPQ